YAYQSIRKMNDTVALFEQARRTIVPKLGADYLLTLTILHNISWTYRAVNRVLEAIELAKQVRVKRLSILEEFHQATLVSLDNLAMGYRASGKLDLALPLFLQAAIGMERLKFAHPEAGRIVFSLCDCLERCNRSDEKGGWWRKSVTAFREKEG